MELNFLISIVDRSRAGAMLALYEGLPLVVTMLGRGTATSEHLSLHGLEATEKAVIASVADAEKNAPDHQKREAQAVYRHPGERRDDGGPGKKRRRWAHVELSYR